MDKRKFCLRKDMNAEQIKKMEAQITKSNNELQPLFNFVEGADAKILEKPGRDDFFKDFHQFDFVYAELDTWDRHELKCYVLVPKGLSQDKKVAFHILFHGGGMVSLFNYIDKEFDTHYSSDYWWWKLCALVHRLQEIHCKRGKRHNLDTHVPTHARVSWLKVCGFASSSRPFGWSRRRWLGLGGRRGRSLLLHICRRNPSLA